MLRQALAVLLVVPLLLSPMTAGAIDVLRPDLWFAPQTCSIEMPDVVIRTTPSEVVIDHGLNYRQIDAKARDLRGAVMAGWRTNGLAAAQLRTDGETSVSVVQIASGEWCGFLDTAEFAISYEDPLRIYISNSYDESSCQYRAILKHELQHVDVYRATLKAHLRGANERVVEIMVAAGPVIARTKQEVAAAIETKVGKAVLDVADGIAAEARQLNATLDTPENYRIVQAECPDW